MFGNLLGSIVDNVNYYLLPGQEEKDEEVLNDYITNYDNSDIGEDNSTKSERKKKKNKTKRMMTISERRNFWMSRRQKRIENKYEREAMRFRIKLAKAEEELKRIEFKNRKYNNVFIWLGSTKTELDRWLSGNMSKDEHYTWNERIANNWIKSRGTRLEMRITNEIGELQEEFCNKKLKERIKKEREKKRDKQEPKSKTNDNDEEDMPLNIKVVNALLIITAKSGPLMDKTEAIRKILDTRTKKEVKLIEPINYEEEMNKNVEMLVKVQNSDYTEKEKEHMGELIYNVIVGLKESISMVDKYCNKQLEIAEKMGYKIEELDIRSEDNRVGYRKELEISSEEEDNSRRMNANRNRIKKKVMSKLEELENHGMDPTYKRLDAETNDKNDMNELIRNIEKDEEEAKRERLKDIFEEIDNGNEETRGGQNDIIEMDEYGVNYTYR